MSYTEQVLLFMVGGGAAFFSAVFCSGGLRNCAGELACRTSSIKQSLRVRMWRAYASILRLSASGTIWISENRMAALKSKRRIGCNVTSELRFIGLSVCHLT
jgi:hypothetical protein